MPARCLICGAAGATCGPRTTSIPVDARITGVKVAGDQLVSDIRVASATPPPDLNDEEREEWETLSAILHKKSLRAQLQERQATAMADGQAPHTMLSYVDRGDGIILKMHPDVARAYVEQNEGAEIVREGALPVTKEGEVIGATKATTGEVFNEDGTQKDDIQPFTTRTFNADMRVRNEVSNPPIGSALSNESREATTTTTPTTDANTGTQARTARPTASKPAATTTTSGSTPPPAE